MSNVFKEFREKNNLTQQEAGELIGVTVWSWKNAEQEKLTKSQSKKYQNAIKFVSDHDLFKPVDLEKLKACYVKPIKGNHLVDLTGFTRDAISGARFNIKTGAKVSTMQNVFLNAAILAIEEEKENRKKAKQQKPLPKMELKTYPAPSIAITPKKTGSIADQIADIESRNEQLEGENAALKLTISTLDLQIQQLSKENELLKVEANTDKSAPVTKEQRDYLVSIVKRYLDKTKGKKVNDYFAKAFWTDIYEDVGPDVKVIDDIKTFNQWLAAVHSAKQRCKAIGLQIESFPVQLSIVS